LNPDESYYFSPHMITYLAGIGGPRTIIHSHNYQAFPALTAALGKLWNGLPLIFTPHYHPFGGTTFRSLLKTLYRPLGKVIFDLSDRVIALSEYERTMLETTFKLNPAKLRVIPAAIDAPLVAPRRRPTNNILYVGRLERYKGLGFLVDCLPLVLQRVPTARLTIVGSGPDGDRLKMAVSRRDLSSYVSFLGNISSSRLQELILTAGLVVMLSEYEAYSLIIAEALLRRVPVVATKVGPIPEIYGKDPKCFFLNYPPRKDELAERIVEVLLTAGLKRKNDEWNLVRLSWDEVTDKIVHVYEELV
jgi:glycosyltransferase involved in cell wall biosynthesis